MKAVVRITPSSYEIGDVIALVPSDHVFSENDLRPGVRESVEIGNVTETEQVLLKMGDERIKGSWAITSVPAFRHSLFKKHNMKETRRRKYTLNGNLEVVKKQ